MSRFLSLPRLGGLLGLGALALVGTAVIPGSAEAHDGWRHRGWGHHHRHWGGPRYYAPPRVYYAPPPRYYYAPPPRVYYAPPPVYYAPRYY